jgi:hypothetical protein
MSLFRLLGVVKKYGESGVKCMQTRTTPLIHAVTVNHNTSPYTELLLRSLYARHSAALDLAITVMDNNSTDDMTSLCAFLAEKQIPLH